MASSTITVKLADGPVVTRLIEATRVLLVAVEGALDGGDLSALRVARDEWLDAVSVAQ